MTLPLRSSPAFLGVPAFAAFAGVLHPAFVGVLHPAFVGVLHQQTVWEIFVIWISPLLKIRFMEPVVYSKYYADYITITCLEWKSLLEQDRFKDIIIDSMSYLARANRINIYGFVIMSNHIHMIWQIMGVHKREDVQRDFLKYTAQQILKILRNEKSGLQAELLVHAKDRKFQIWERNSLSIPLWSNKVMWQKLEYIHFNPVRAGMCLYPEDYKYSSATFYYHGERKWDFLSHFDG